VELELTEQYEENPPQDAIKQAQAELAATKVRNDLARASTTLPEY